MPVVAQSLPPGEMLERRRSEEMPSVKGGLDRNPLKTTAFPREKIGGLVLEPVPC